MQEHPLDKILEAVRKQYDLPALGASVIVPQQTLTSVVGYRKAGDPTQATRTDKFHLGSCTKTMTATMIAMQVEQGKLRWETTLAELFPELQLNPDYGGATIEQLLTHRAGMPPPERSYPEGVNWYLLKGTPREHRRRYLQAVLSQPPDFKPGTRAQYSNAGYVVLGAILEKLHQEEWERLAHRLLFRPLGMTSAGYGPMVASDKVDQPWQHKQEGDKKVAIGSTLFADNAPVLAPAGRVHCSLIDWAKFIQTHLPNAGQKPRLLKPATLERMQTPYKDSHFGMGWLIVERGWAGGKALTHAGSNTMSYAVVWVAPHKNSAVMVATNQGGAEAQSGTDQACARIISEFF